MWRGPFILFAVALIGGAQALFVSAIAGPHDALIAKHAAANGLPEHLVRRVVRAESGGNAAAVNAGNYGLMQIRLATARSIGYSGDATGLLDPDTNLTYAVKYLAGAYRAAGCDADRAVSLYMRGYYGAAKKACAVSPVEVAQGDTKAEAGSRREAPAAKSRLDAAAPVAGVIKPKVVRTETIGAPNSASVSSPPVGKFEPSRITPPLPPRPVEASAALAAPASAPKAAVASPILPAAVSAPALPTTTKTDKLAPAPAFDLASVPLPPARREPEASPKPDVQPSRRAKRATEHVAERKSEHGPARAENKSALASIGDPAAVVTFLKKLVTPDTKSRRRTVEAEAPPSQLQPPQ